MNTVEQDKLLLELKENKNMEENLKKVNSLVSTSNAWLNLKNRVDKNEYLKPFISEVSEELWRDGCFSASTHMYELINLLLEKIEENQDPD